jgi:hypothetical protein
VRSTQLPAKSVTTALEIKISNTDASSKSIPQIVAESHMATLTYEMRRRREGGRWCVFEVVHYCGVAIAEVRLSAETDQDLAVAVARERFADRELARAAAREDEWQAAELRSKRR